MNSRDFDRRIIQLIIGFFFAWLICLTELMIYGSAYGGIFTIVAGWVMEAILSALAVGLAFLLGFILLIPCIRKVWRKARYWNLLLSVAGVACIAFASKLGLRTVNPVSSYEMMPFRIWSVCILCVVFPVVNFPLKPEKSLAESTPQV